MHLKLFHLPFESPSFSFDLFVFSSSSSALSLVIPDFPSYLLIGIILCDNFESLLFFILS